jgi:predicted small lipoprotein YifL
MRLPRYLALAAAAVGLTACVSAAPLRLPDDHPASPKAAAGRVDTPTAIADYKGPDEFAARAAADAKSSGGRGSMPGMSGMKHGGMDQGAMPGMSHEDMQGMPGMQHGGAPQGAGSR